MSASRFIITLGNYFFALLIFSIATTPQLVQADESFYDQVQVVDREGKPSDLNKYQGKVVLLNFWASWCPPCVKEMPSMQRLQNNFDAEEFQVIAVNMGQSLTTVDSFLLEQDFSFDLPVYLDEPGRSFITLKVQGMPSSFLIGSDGQLIETIVGAREWDHPDNIKGLRQLIAEQSNPEAD